MSTTTPAPVVLAADGTPSSEGALRYAVREAMLRHTQLIIVHVNPMATPVGPIRPIPGYRPAIPAELDVHARKVLERVARAASSLAPDLPVSSLLSHGARVPAIVDAAVGAQLLVMGRETRRGVERVLTGATTAAVASRTGCPVVVVPGDWHPREGAERGRVVVGIRTPGAAATLMTEAHGVASRLGVPITVLHAWELSDPAIDRMEARGHADEWQIRGQRLLEEALADWRTEHGEESVETRVVHGHAASVLAGAAEDADLVLVRRAHDHRPFDHLGGTVRALLLECPGPVEVVPTQPTPVTDEVALEESGHLIP